MINGSFSTLINYSTGGGVHINSCYAYLCRGIPLPFLSRFWSIIFNARSCRNSCKNFLALYRYRYVVLWYLVYPLLFCCQCDLSRCQYVNMAICLYRYTSFLLAFLGYLWFFTDMKIKNYVPKLHAEQKTYRLPEMAKITEKGPWARGLRIWCPSGLSGWLL